MKPVISYRTPQVFGNLFPVDLAGVASCAGTLVLPFSSFVVPAAPDVKGACRLEALIVSGGSVSVFFPVVATEVLPQLCRAVDVGHGFIRSALLHSLLHRSCHSEVVDTNIGAHREFAMYGRRLPTLERFEAGGI